MNLPRREQRREERIEQADRVLVSFSPWRQNGKLSVGGWWRPEQLLSELQDAQRRKRLLPEAFAQGREEDAALGWPPANPTALGRGMTTSGVVISRRDYSISTMPLIDRLRSSPCPTRREGINVILARTEEIEEVQAHVFAGLADAQQDEVILNSSWR